MKTAINSLACATLLFVGAQALAGDDMSKTDMMAKKEMMMKDCMKEQAAMKAGMSQADMKKACDEKVMKMMKEDDMTKPK